MIVIYISYSDMDKNKRYFKHRTSTIFHSLDPGIFNNIGGGLADFTIIQYVSYVSELIKILMSKHLYR
jgi:hypothetical protein